MNDKSPQDKSNEPTEPVAAKNKLAQILNLADDQLGLLDKIAPSIAEKLSRKNSAEIGIEGLSEVVILPVSPHDLRVDAIEESVSALADDYSYEIFWIDPQKPERGALFVQLSIALTGLAPILAFPWVRRVELPQKVALEPGNEQ